MTCSLTLSSTDVAAGRIAARHRARIAHLRAGSCAAPARIAHLRGSCAAPARMLTPSPPCYFSCYSCDLLCVPKQAFVPATTDSRHRWRIHPNLARRLTPTAVNQLWVADITYVRLAEEFVYLAVILDAFSRRVIGWSLAAHLQASLALEALEMALASRDVTPGGLIHHSDRGVQYACGDYIARLEQAGIQPSMSRVGCPWDNAMAESFMKTLKSEEIDGRDYRDLNDAKGSIGRFIEVIYNRQRLHSALAYRPPMEFEEVQTSDSGRGHAPTLNQTLISTCV
jgi:transposase InsO family protein